MEKTCQTIQELIPAYLLDALDEAERAAVQEHLPECPNCLEFVRAYQPVLEALPFAAEQVEPPPDLKSRVLAMTTGVAPVHQPADSRQSAVPLKRALSSQAAPGRFAWLSSFFRSPALSAVALVLVLALGMWNLALQNQMAQQSAELSRQNQFLTMLAYSDGAPKHLTGTDAAAEAVGRLYGGYEDNTFVVVTWDMPKLPPDKVYQLWLIDATGKRTSGGTFTVDANGSGWLFSRAPHGLQNYTGVGVTVEPAGGSPGPTAAKMLGGSL